MSFHNFSQFISSVFLNLLFWEHRHFVILVYLSAHYPILMPLLVATSLLAILYVVISNKNTPKDEKRTDSRKRAVKCS